MDKQKLTLIIIGLVVVLGFLSLMVVVLQMKKNAPPGEEENKIIPTPTAVENIFKVPTATPLLSPTEIPAASHTGALDEQLPPAIQDLATQKQELKSKLPINNANFVLVFDYGEDKFIVDLKNPKETNKTIFEDWLKANYPAIPLDRFIIK
jgi:hypothetical protein